MVHILWTVTMPNGIATIDAMTVDGAHALQAAGELGYPTDCWNCYKVPTIRLPDVFGTDPSESYRHNNNGRSTPRINRRKTTYTVFEHTTCPVTGMLESRIVGEYSTLRKARRAVKNTGSESDCIIVRCD